MEKRSITDEKLQKVFQVTTCTDVDECSEGEHTCHPSATCRNTLGGSVSSFFVMMLMVMVCLFRVCLLFLLLIFSTLKSFSCWAVEPLDSPYQTSLSPPCQTKFSSAGTPALALTPHTPLISAPPPACSRESNTWMGESQIF